MIRAIRRALGIGPMEFPRKTTPTWVSHEVAADRLRQDLFHIDGAGKYRRDAVDAAIQWFLETRPAFDSEERALAVHNELIRRRDAVIADERAQREMQVWALAS